MPPCISATLAFETEVGRQGKDRKTMELLANQFTQPTSSRISEKFCLKIEGKTQ